MPSGVEGVHYKSYLIIRKKTIFRVLARAIGVSNQKCLTYHKSSIILTQLIISTNIYTSTRVPSWIGCKSQTFFLQSQMKRSHLLGKMEAEEV